jgi:hypothetical protein
VVAAEDRLLIDLTEKSGVQPGQEYSVFRKGQPFRHPINGRPLGRYEDILGYAQIVRLHPQYSEAVFVPAGGGVAPEAEDGVRITRGRIRVAVTGRRPHQSTRPAAQPFASPARSGRRSGSRS